MASEWVEASRDGLVEALETLPGFAMSIVKHVQNDDENEDHAALAHLDELTVAVDTWRQCLIGLMAERSTRKGMT